MDRDQDRLLPRIGAAERAATMSNAARQPKALAMSFQGMAVTRSSRRSSTDRRNDGGGIHRSQAEAATTLPVFGTRHEKASRFRTPAAIAAKGGDDFREVRFVPGPDCQHHDPVAGILPVEAAAILFRGLAGLERGAVDRLPGIGEGVADGAVGAGVLEVGEEFGKAWATAAQQQSSS